jgi:uncharacterized protein YdgA (DUF945 family)
MNKQVYALVALGGVLLSVVGASAFSGGAVTSRLSEQTVALGKLLPGLKLEEQIDRGLFSTTRTVKLRLGCVPKPGAGGSVGRMPPLELRWRDTIQHGPLPGGKTFALALIDSELLLPDSLKAQAQQVIGDKSPLTAHTRIGFGGNFESDTVVPGVKVKLSATEEVSFSGLTLRSTGRFPMGAGTLSYSGSLAPLSFHTKTSDGALDVSMGAADFTGSVKVDPKIASFLVPFQSEGSIDSIKVSTQLPSAAGVGQAPVEFSLDKVKGKSDSSLDKELWSYRSSMSGVLHFKDVVIDKVELGSGIKRLHGPTYAKLLSQLIETSLSCDKPLDAKDPMAAFEGMLDDGFALLTHDPEYSVGPIAVELAGKRAELSYSVGMRGVTLNDKLVPFVALLQQKSVARADVKADLALVDEFLKLANKFGGLGPAGAQQGALPPGTPDPNAIMARAMIEGFVAQGYLVREGESVRASIESVAGALKLNGKPFAMPDLSSLGGP